MTAPRKAALAAAICLVLPVISSASASAARSLTVTPSTDLVELQTVSVAGGGFSPSTTIDYCQAIMDATPDQSDCGVSYQVTTSSSSGDFSGQFTVRQSMYVPSLGRTVDCWVESCFIGAAEDLDVAGTATFSAPLTFVHVQPDGQIRRLSDGTIFGDDVYNSNGSSGQTVTHTVAGGADWSFAVQVQNDGQRTDSIKVTASPVVSSPDIAVRDFADWFDVTSRVTGTGLTFANVPPGEIRRLAVQFRANSGAPIGARSHQLVTFTAGNAPVRDAVRVGVRVVAPT
jgi:hypothetical protein